MMFNDPAAAVPPPALNIPTPEELKALAIHGQWEALNHAKKNRNFYVLTRGYAVGVYNDWDEVKTYYDGVQQAIQETYSSLEDALHAYTIAYNEGTVTPIRTTRAGLNKLATRPNTMPAPKARSSTLRDPDIYEGADANSRIWTGLKGKNKKRGYYVVKRGSEPGIYGTWHQAAIRTLGVPASEQAKLVPLHWDEAKRVYREAYQSGNLAILFDPRFVLEAAGTGAVNEPGDEGRETRPDAPVLVFNPADVEELAAQINTMLKINVTNGGPEA